MVILRRILFGRSKNNSNESIFYILANLVIHYSLPLNHHLVEPVIFHTNSVSGMVNKIRHIPTLSFTGKCPKFH